MLTLMIWAREGTLLVRPLEMPGLGWHVESLLLVVNSDLLFLLLCIYIYIILFYQIIGFWSTDLYLRSVCSFYMYVWCTLSIRLLMLLLSSLS